MTAHTERLLDAALDYWQMGHQIPIDLYSNMAAAGMDVPALEQIHMKEEQV